MGKTILVVENDDITREVMAVMLQREGYTTILKANGREALDYLLSEPAPDLILLDLSMPFMDGEETFGRLRAINPDVVVLLSTGFIAKERLDRMLAAGMAGFLRKPHRPDELVIHVRSVLERAKMARAGCIANTLAAS